MTGYIILLGVVITAALAGVMVFYLDYRDKRRGSVGDAPPPPLAEGSMRSFEEFCRDRGLDPDSAQARAKYARWAYVRARAERGRQVFKRVVEQQDDTGLGREQDLQAALDEYLAHHNVQELRATLDRYLARYEAQAKEGQDDK